MKGPIPTTAEHINIAGTEEPLNNSVIQLQISEAFHDDVKASVPVVHEITTGTGEYFEYCTVRVLKRASLRFLKRNYIRLKVVLHPSRCHEITMKGKNRGEAHTNTIEQPALRNSSNWMASCQSICMTTSKGKVNSVGNICGGSGQCTLSVNRTAKPSSSTRILKPLRRTSAISAEPVVQAFAGPQLQAALRNRRLETSRNKTLRSRKFPTAVDSTKVRQGSPNSRSQVVSKR